MRDVRSQLGTGGCRKTQKTVSVSLLTSVLMYRGKLYVSSSLGGLFEKRSCTNQIEAEMDIPVLFFEVYRITAYLHFW